MVITHLARGWRRGLMGLVAAVVLPTVAFAASAWDAGTDGLMPIPALKARVSDLTATLSGADIAALDGKLAAWEQQTGNQLVVLIVPTTKPEPIEAYSIRVADAWKIGRKGQDNGALLMVAKDDKKLRIEVGYGLEGVLTDATSRAIIGDTIAPLLRQNQFAQGITAGVDRIIAVVDKGEPLAAKPVAKQQRASGAAGIPFEMLLIIIFVVVPVVGGILRRIFGKGLGSTVGAGIIGAAAWVVAGSLLIAIIIAVVAFIVMLFAGTGSGLARGTGGVWLPGGGGGFGGGGGGGGFSGGGGGFGGGGASGGWD
ncbi:MAG: TPM domain-containing protein [Betaproteobacteria bacterium]